MMLPVLRAGLGALVAASLACAGCGPPVVENVPIKDLSAEDGEDLSVTPIPDLAGADLTGEDLAGADLTGVIQDMPPRAWVDVSIPIANDFYSVWSNNAGLAYIVGTATSPSAPPALYKSVNGMTFAIDSGSARPTSPTGTGNFNVLGIGGLLPGPPTGPLYVTGKFGQIWSYTGDLAAGTGSWVAQTNPATATQTVWNVWVAPDGVCFAVGNGFAARKDTTTWSALTGITTPGTDVANNVSGSKAGGYSIYAVGNGGKIWYSTGGAFAAQTSGVTTDLYGVVAFSATDIYAVGLGGVILHSTGTGTWTQQPKVVNDDLEAIAGVNADEIYIAGAGGAILKKTGAASTTWVKETLPNPLDARVFNGVWAGTKAIYVVGQSGAILRK